MSFSTDTIVIGAGVVGLACARALARTGQEVIIIERHAAIGTEISSRNSEVIHAGIYYKPGSLKALLCVSGKSKLYQFCDEYGVGYRRCGKLILAAKSDQERELQSILKRGEASGVTDLLLLSAREVQALEPELQCSAAILSPSTGIIDSHGLMVALLGDAERHGAKLVLRTPVEKIITTKRGFDVLTGGETPSWIRCKNLINAAGLSATQVASSIVGLNAAHIPRLYTAKGNYFSISGKAPFSRLVYPVPEPGGLGVHFTLDLGGGGRFGPDVEWIEKIDYTVDRNRSRALYSAISSYWPRLVEEMLTPAYCGIRPKLSGPGSNDSDFLIQDDSTHQIRGLINLFGIESPGLTSSLAIAELCAGMVSE